MLGEPKSISSLRGAIKQYRAMFFVYPLEVSQFAVPRYRDIQVIFFHMEYKYLNSIYMNLCLHFLIFQSKKSQIYYLSFLIFTFGAGLSMINWFLHILLCSLHSMISFYS